MPDITELTPLERNLLWNGRTLAETTREAAEKKEALEAARSRKAEAAIQLADLVTRGGGGRSAIEDAEEAYGDADDAYADALEAEEAAGDVAHEHAKMVADLMRQKQHRLARLQNEHRDKLAAYRRYEQLDEIRGDIEATAEDVTAIARAQRAAGVH